MKHCYTYFTPPYSAFAKVLSSLYYPLHSALLIFFYYQSIVFVAGVKVILMKGMRVALYLALHAVEKKKEVWKWLLIIGVKIDSGLMHF